MREVIITSNGPENNTELNNVVKNIFRNLKKILIIPGFSDNDFTITRKVKANYPNSIILDFSKINLVNLNEIDGIIFCAGKPDKLLKAIEKTGIKKMLKNSAVPIMASSAGSLVLSETCIITPDEEYPKLITLPGLGIVPFCVEVHYSKECDKHLKKIKGKLIYCLEDNSGIIFSNDKVKTFGNVKLWKT